MTHPAAVLDLDEATMRQLGGRVVDIVARHLASLREQRVHSPEPRRTVAGVIRGPAPEGPGDPEALLTWLTETVLRRSSREPHPGFLAYVPSCPTFPAIAGDWLATGFNPFAGVWPVAPGPNQLELLVMDWFRSWLGMPEGTSGLFTSGGSSATMTAVVAARHAALREDTAGINRLTLYTSDQAHSSVARAAWIAGIPRDNVRTVGTDDDYHLRPDLLLQAVARDRAAGLLPFMVVASAGTTNTGAVDPLRAIGEFCRREDLWYHVDAAYGGC
jgi:glutamate/tyrosine decarboxylase-like PLP-dependent enzyme